MNHTESTPGEFEGDLSSDASLVIDCDSCQVRPRACGDCVVSVLLGPIEDESVEWDAEERRAMAVLADSGLVPRLRLVRAEEGPSGGQADGQTAGSDVHGSCPQDLPSKPTRRQMLG